MPEQVGDRALGQQQAQRRGKVEFGRLGQGLMRAAGQRRAACRSGDEGRRAGWQAQQQDVERRSGESSFAIPLVLAEGSSTISVAARDAAGNVFAGITGTQAWNFSTAAVVAGGFAAPRERDVDEPRRPFRVAVRADPRTGDILTPCPACGRHALAPLRRSAGQRGLRA